MATDYTNSTYEETIWDAEAYEAEPSMGSRSYRSSNTSRRGGSTGASSGTTPSLYDSNFPRYVPPHKRGVNLEMGDTVQVAGLRPGGDEQGVDNAAFQKLIVYVSFALVREMVAKLSTAFPGMFFVSKSHDNHDHPFSHVVTQVGTRLLQRMFPPGSRILDIYGSPLACARFNISQARARLPKTMYSNVLQTGGTNFIREVNKWGAMWTSAGPPNFIRARVNELRSVFLARYDCFQLIHTLYYVTNEDLNHLLHSPIEDLRPGAAPRKKALCLIHAHPHQHGEINHGEQRYQVRNGIVKQTNVATNSTYCHPNITPFWFQQKKEWYNDAGVGFVWELHGVCKDTWIVEIVAARRDEVDLMAEDWEAAFDLGEFENAQTTSLPARGRRADDVIEMLPSKSGKFVALDINNRELVTALRSFATGKPRTGVEGGKLMKELIGHARNLVFPSSLYPERTPMSVKEGTMIDHVASAFLTDVERETNVVELMDSMQGMIYQHSTALTGKRPSTAMGADWLGTLRLLAKVGVVGAKAARNKDPLGSALGQIDNFLS